MAKAKKPQPNLPFATNRKAKRDYEILDKIEAGIELKGTEVKSIRQRHLSLDGSFARIDRDEVWLYNVHINPYEQGNRQNPDPDRERKLLLHRKEIRKIQQQMKQNRLTLVPLKVYQKRGLVKVELGIARGKRQYEKRDTIIKREADRKIARTLRQEQKRVR